MFRVFYSKILQEGDIDVHIDKEQVEMSSNVDKNLHFITRQTQWCLLPKANFALFRPLTILMSWFILICHIRSTPAVLLEYVLYIVYPTWIL